MKIGYLFLVAIFVLPAFAQPAIDCAGTEKKLSEAERKLNDWAELNRYAKENAQVGPPKKNEDRVIFIGDSITDLWDEKGFGGFFPGKPYLNRGISGQTTAQMLLRFRADVIANRPRVVIILAGTNDIAGNTGPTTLEQTADNISSMAELAKINRIRVVIASVLPVSDTVRKNDGGFYSQTKSRPAARIVAMNKWLSEYATRNQIVYLDYYSAMTDENGYVKDGLTYDGLHPNAEGYALMAPIAERSIRQALRNKR